MMKLGVQVGLGPGHIVLDEDPAPPPLKGHSPQFAPISVVAKRLHRSRFHLIWSYVRWEPAPPPQKRGRSSQFSAHVYCDQTAGWIKIILRTEVGLSPGDLVVLDGDPVPSPIFGPFLLWPNGWIHQDATRYGARPQPRGLCVRWGPSPSLPKGRGAPHIFGSCLFWPNGRTS